MCDAFATVLTDAFPRSGKTARFDSNDARAYRSVREDPNLRNIDLGPFGSLSICVPALCRFAKQDFALPCCHFAVEHFAKNPLDGSDFGGHGTLSSWPPTMHVRYHQDSNSNDNLKDIDRSQPLGKSIRGFLQCAACNGRFGNPRMPFRGDEREPGLRNSCRAVIIYPVPTPPSRCCFFRHI